MISLCPLGHKGEIQFQDEEGLIQARCAANGSLIDRELVKWANIKGMVNQGRRMDIMGYGPKDGHEGIQQLIMI
jgi:hypothetical protein